MPRYHSVGLPTWIRIYRIASYQELGRVFCEPMKKLFLLLGFVGILIFSQNIQAQPILSGLYNSISNQLFIVSNSPPVDSKLAKSLNAALTAIQKGSGNTNLITSIKALSSTISII